MLTLLLALVSVVFQGVATRPVVDNDVFTVLEVTWPAGYRNSMHEMASDTLLIYLSNGTMRLNSPDGATRSITVNPGYAQFEAKGNSYAEENTSSAPIRAIVVHLKEHRDPPLPNTSGYPNAFPRPGVKNILENDRVVVWDYTWKTGEPTPLHFHDKYVVVVYLEDGALRSTTLDGNSVVNEISFGLTTANPRARLHTEELVRGKARAVIMELK